MLPLRSLHVQRDCGEGSNALEVYDARPQARDGGRYDLEAMAAADGLPRQTRSMKRRRVVQLIQQRLWKMRLRS